MSFILTVAIWSGVAKYKTSQAIENQKHLIALYKDTYERKFTKEEFKALNLRKREDVIKTDNTLQAGWFSQIFGRDTTIVADCREVFDAAGNSLGTVMLVEHTSWLWGNSFVERVYGC